MPGQRDPGRHRGARQRGRFLERQIAGDGNGGFLVDDRVLGQHAVEVGAEAVGEVIRLDRTAEPARVEAADDASPIANRRAPAPSATTSPAPSLSGTTPSFVGPRPPPFSTIKSR